MTAAARPPRPPLQVFSLPLAFSIALRELRAGAGGLTVFVLCIALGVAAVAAIGSLAASFDEALARQGRLLIGGDLSFELIHRQAKPTSARRSMRSAKSANRRASAPWRALPTARAR